MKILKTRLTCYWNFMGFGSIRYILITTSSWKLLLLKMPTHRTLSLSLNILQTLNNITLRPCNLQRSTIILRIIFFKDILIIFITVYLIRINFYKVWFYKTRICNIEFFKHIIHYWGQYIEHFLSLNYFINCSECLLSRQT